MFSPYKYIFIVDILEIFHSLIVERLLQLTFPQMSVQRIKEINCIA